MQYFSTMSLKEYLQTNYSEIPPELFGLLERTATQYEELQIEKQDMSDAFDDLEREAKGLVQDLQDRFYKFDPDVSDPRLFSTELEKILDEVRF